MYYYIRMLMYIFARMITCRQEKKNQKAKETRGTLLDRLTNEEEKKRNSVEIDSERLQAIRASPT